MSALLRSLAALVLLPLLLAGVVRAETFLADGYAVRVWQTNDGLPENLVVSAVQTRDGYLWFGTYGGLTRFDGERFEVYDSENSPGLQDRRVLRLFEDDQGTLWIGHDSGLVTRYRDGRFEPVLQPGNASNEKIIGLGSDEQGRRWAMHENGSIANLDDGTLVPTLIAGDRPGVMNFSQNPKAGIWVVENGRAAHLSQGKLVPAELPQPKSNNYVGSLAASADGGAWLLCDRRVRRWDNNRWVEDRGEIPWPDGSLACSLELRDGTLAVGTIQSGLYLVFPDGRRPIRFSRANGLPQDWIRFLYEDREGNLWAGAGGAGLVSIHPTAFSVLTLPTGAHGCSVLSVAAAPDGSLWIGTDGAALYHRSGDKWEQFTPEKGLGNWYVPSVAVAADGAVWASDFWWGGPYRLEEGRFVRPPGIEETSNPAYSLLPSSPQECLIGNRNGLRLWKDGESTWLAKSPDSSAPDVCSIAREANGVVWCGFARGGIARIAPDRTTYFRRSDGLASDLVNSLCIDTEGTLWIGTADRGLSRFKDGRFVTLGQSEGLADHTICAVLDDGRGYLWLSTHHGIQRISKTELNRCADGAAKTFSSQVYDRSDGLPIVAFTSGFQAVACKTPDGRLWFASGKGLVNVDPARIESNTYPPPVVIGSMLADGKPTALVSGIVTHSLPPGHQRLEFRFSGLSYVAPSKVLFKYRLDGIDQDWIDGGTKRNAFYSRLPAGNYLFRVIACNNDGVWSPEAATLAFTVAPFFWQTGWFITLCALAAAGSIAWVARAITHRRMQRKMEAMERRHEIERERSRIAQDIHDDVGASLSKIAMLSQPGRGDLTEPERAAAMLSRIYTSAREVTQALDEIVWAVDPRHDTLDSLVDYMGRFAQDYLASSSVRCRLDLPVQVPSWPLTAETRHNLFLAFKEALNNAMKHAAASEVHVSVSVGEDSFSFVIKDNGRGFDPQNPAPLESTRFGGGRGVGNMQKRMERIGGRCGVTSQPGAGTTVSLTVEFPRPSAQG
ncbi:hypothetical protein DB347_07385 [Opitutaceae bacterium EW11]|nr:hypothetical protein DB347_07385 [Opitutaceae bacterium EW11]